MYLHGRKEQPSHHRGHTDVEENDEKDVRGHERDEYARQQCPDGKTDDADGENRSEQGVRPPVISPHIPVLVMNRGQSDEIGRQLSDTDSRSHRRWYSC